MIGMLKTVKINIWQIVGALALLLIGDWLALSGIQFLSPVSIFLYFVFFGMLALLLVLGWTNTKLLFDRLILQNSRWIPVAFFGSFLFSAIFFYYRNSLTPPSYRA